MTPDNIRPGESAEHTVKAIVNGDRAHNDALRRLVTNFVVSRGPFQNIDAEELAGDIVGAVFENLKNGRFRGTTLAEFYSYVYSTARNSIKYYHRKTNRMTYVSSVPELDAEVTATISAQFASADFSQRILARLDDNCRNLLQLKFHRGWSDQEVADHVGKSKNAVSTAISRCLQKAQRLDIVQEFL